MNAYFLVIMADILLAVVFALQKKYQQAAGTALKAGLAYNALMGACSAIIFLGITGFQVNISLFSVVMAALFCITIMLYVMIGFKIMEKGNLALYTLFLMSGGMTVPYIWGVLFLNEEFTILRTLGLIAIIAAIALSNSGAKKPDKKQLLMCVAIFFLNGTSSVLSKMHQIHPVSATVTSQDFVFLVSLFKALICAGLILFNKKKLHTDGKKLGLKKLMPIIILAALADGLSYMLQLMGASELPATVLYPLITGGSIILTSLAGIAFYKEKLSVQQWIAMAVCVAGTGLFL